VASAAPGPAGPRGILSSCSANTAADGPPAPWPAHIGPADIEGPREGAMAADKWGVGPKLLPSALLAVVYWPFTTPGCEELAFKPAADGSGAMKARGPAVGPAVGRIVAGRGGTGMSLGLGRRSAFGICASPGRTGMFAPLIDGGGWEGGMPGRCIGRGTLPSGPTGGPPPTGCRPAGRRCPGMAAGGRCSALKLGAGLGPLPVP
jgi:hypothetical protein